MDGLVVAAHGRRGIVQDTSAERLPYSVYGRQLKPCCGDRVLLERQGAGEPVLVTGIAPRDNELLRQSGRYGRPEPIAANLSHLLVVMAALPMPDLFVTDRYLCAARLMGVSCALVWNKSDYATPPAELLAPYQALDYSLFTVSASSGAGVDAIAAWIGRGIAILVGQSGVGKSSLLNAMAPEAEAATAAISSATAEGKHTTTAAVLHGLTTGGSVIDTPGVRDFVPAVPDLPAVSAGFVEILSHGEHCRFANCSHLREIDCAVQDAVDAGEIDPRRFESYRRLMNLTRQAGDY